MGVPGVVDRALQSTGGHLLESAPPDPECGCQGAPNSMDIHQSVLGCILSPRTAVKCDFPEDFLEISQFKQNADCCKGMPHVSHEECGYQGVLSSLHVHQAGGGSFKTPQ